MNSEHLYKLSSDLYNLLLYLHDRILDPSEISKNFLMPPSHVKVIIYLKHKGASSISEVGKHLVISRPNMTPIIDNLISEGMVDRYRDENDRRIVRVEITDKAYEFLKEQEGLVKKSLSEKISTLDSESLESLSQNVSSIRDIILRIDK